MQEPDDLSETGPLLEVSRGLLYFVQNAQLPVFSGNTQLNLMDLFPFAKSGFAFVDSLLNILGLYFYLNGLFSRAGEYPEVIFDDLLIMSFGSSIPRSNGDATLQYDHDIFDSLLINPNVDILLEYPLVLSEQPNSFIAIQQEVEIAKYLAGRIEFMVTGGTSSLNISLEDYTKISRLSIYSLIEEIITDINYIQAELYGDEELLRKAEACIEKISAVVKGVDLLVTSVLVNNIQRVKYYLQTFDPRDNNYLAYRYAVKQGNLEIINLLKNNILERDFFEQQVFQSRIEQPMGAPSTSIYNLTRRQL